MLALGLRTYRLGARPMHADEANQAVKLGQTLEGSTYVFDPRDHHGPTLYYLALIPARLRGEATLAELTETTVRLTPALAGVVAVGLLWLLVRPCGRSTAFIAALFLAVSPAAVYYSRYFIQETLLVTFTLGALISGQAWWRNQRAGWAATAGVCLGLMLATKSSALVFAAAALLAVGRWPERPGSLLLRDAAIAAVSAAIVAASFYSAFGSHPAGLRDMVLSPGAMLSRVTGGASGHEKPWWYYASLFLYQRNGGYVWDQTVFVIPAFIGGFFALQRSITKGAGASSPSGLLPFAAVYSTIVAVVLSATPYKTPWLVVSVIPALCILAAWALAHVRAWKAVCLALVVVFGLAWQTRQAVFLRPADPRNPFAYVHTVPDMLKVPALAAAAPAGRVKVISSEYWPLPWYLRNRPETGYWTEPPVDCDGALVFAGADQAEAVRSRLRGRYQESILGLRPGFALAVFTRQGQ